VGLVACASVVVPAQSPQTAVSTERARLIQDALTDASRSTRADLSEAERAQLAAVYRDGGWATLWVDPANRPHADAREALQLLDGATADGLNPGDYDVAALRVMAVALDAASSPAPTDVASFDVGMSLGMSLFYRDLHAGRVDPRAIGFRMTIGRDEHNFPSLLRSALAAHRLAETASELAPQFALYRGLREALMRYRGLASNPLPDLPDPAGRAVHLGDTYAGLRDLRRRLVVLGDWPADVRTPRAPREYDRPFVEGVKRFQIRHGLDADGVLGPETLAAMHVPLTWRLRQIELGLERLRWLPHLGRGRLLAVNIPMFRLWAWDSMIPGDVPAFGSRVIVGRALDTETPVFVDEMSHIVFRPYWNVPPSILRHEILPVLARDPAYLTRQNMEIVDGAGDDARPVEVTADSIARLRQGYFRVRQRPGPSNALGLVKFVFPNDLNVYLHGTPTIGLFARSRRDFSHGCVRVEDAAALAEWALAEQGDWSRDRVLAAMNAPEQTRVDLKQPITVILFYITAVVTPEDGTVHFARDIYGHDSRLNRALGFRGPGQQR
jgi:murein L,D-transpeptidase YcbB/YkuD